MCKWYAFLISENLHNFDSHFSFNIARNVLRILVWIAYNGTKAQIRALRNSKCVPNLNITIYILQSIRKCHAGVCHVLVIGITCFKNLSNQLNIFSSCETRTRIDYVLLLQTYEWCQFYTWREDCLATPSVSLWFSCGHTSHTQKNHPSHKNLAHLMRQIFMRGMIFLGILHK